jgi:hypothetical protein
MSVCIDLADFATDAVTGFVIPGLVANAHASEISICVIPRRWLQLQLHAARLVA